MDEVKNLIKDAICHLKETPTSCFSTRQEWEALQLLQKTSLVVSSYPSVQQPLLPSSPPSQNRKITPEREKSFSSVASAPQIKKLETPLKEETKIKQFLEHCEIAVSDMIPDDQTATRTMFAWQENMEKIDILILSCDADTSTLAMIKKLAKAMDQKLGKTRIVSVQRLENEQKWSSFLEKNSVKLIIATAGFAQLSPTMHHSSKNDTHSFLGKNPLIILSPFSFYDQFPKEKNLLWNQINSLLQH